MKRKEAPEKCMYCQFPTLGRWVFSDKVRLKPDKPIYKCLSCGKIQDGQK